VGEIEVRGPCVMKGYRGRPECTADVFRAGGWLRTGDRGYLADGELFVVGRQKDVIKKLGLSFDASSIEAAVRTVRGIREGRVAAFGAHGTDAVERMVIAVETALTDLGSLRELRGDAIRAVVTECGVRPDAIVCVRPGSLPRTTSGKLQRYLCRSLFEAGSLTELPQVRAELRPDRLPRKGVA
jgi:fatty-acyl-CoA synthase